MRTFCERAVPRENPHRLSPHNDGVRLDRNSDSFCGGQLYFQTDVCSLAGTHVVDYADHCLVEYKNRRRSKTQRHAEERSLAGQEKVMMDFDSYRDAYFTHPAPEARFRFRSASQSEDDELLAP